MSIYFPVDVNFYDSPEFFEVNMSARGLWVTCGTWCKRHLTDGVIPAKIVRHLGGTVRQIKTLIKKRWKNGAENGGNQNSDHALKTVLSSENQQNRKAAHPRMSTTMSTMTSLA